MDHPVALPDIIGFLAAFRHCFTAPGFFYFQQFVQHFWLGEGRRTVTAVYRQARAGQHFSNFHRFLKTYRWEPEAVTRTLVTHVLTQLGCGPDPTGCCWVNAALDDTLTRKWGRKMEAASWQHDPMSPAPKGGKPPLAFGHCWVMLGLLRPHGERWLFLAWAAWLFRPPKVTPQDQQETKLELVVRRLKEWKLPTWLRLRVVADGAYGKRTLVDGLRAQGHHVISRLPGNAVLFEIPTPPQEKRRGRPRFYGEKRAMPHFAALAATAPLQTLRLYGRDWRVRVAAFRQRSRALGGREIQLVVVIREGTRVSKPIFLFTTDLTLTPEQVVELYAARFAIELGFRDLKQHFGLGHYQARRAVAAERHVTLCLVAYTWSQLLLIAGRYGALGEPWRVAPPLVTTGQLRYQVRKEQQVRNFLALCERHQIPAKKRAAMAAELALAA
jgi:hypothetical protein